MHGWIFRTDRGIAVTLDYEFAQSECAPGNRIVHVESVDRYFRFTDACRFAEFNERDLSFPALQALLMK